MDRYLVPDDSNHYSLTLIIAHSSLDTIHLAFSAVMMYLSLSSPVGLLDNSHLWLVTLVATCRHRR